MDRWAAVVFEVKDHGPAGRMASAMLAVAVGLATVACGDQHQQRRSDEPATSSVFEQYSHVGPPRPESRFDDQRRRSPDRAVELTLAIDAPGDYRGRSVRGEANIQRLVSGRVFYVGASEHRRLLVAVGPRVEVLEELGVGHDVRIYGRLVDGHTARTALAPDLGPLGEQALRDQTHVVLVSQSGRVRLASRDRR